MYFTSAEVADLSGAPEVSIVVPLYNEAENLSALYARVSAAMASLEIDYELVLVNDGSRDQTAVQADALHAQDARVVVIHLSRNFGHQAAVSAGIDQACGRAVIVMDGDLQDPPEVLGHFIAAWKAGNEVVYAVRTERKEGILKRTCYALFYRLYRGLSDLDVPLDSGDFCLMDRRVVEALKQLPEQGRFVRGLRTFVGFRQVGLTYRRDARHAGQPKYTFRALLRLAIEGLISFSSFPLTMVTYLGLFSLVLAFFLSGWVLWDACYNHTTPRGWASMILAVLFMGGFQLLSLGIMAEYIRRIFLETKRRPTYLIHSIRGREAAHPESARRKRSPTSAVTATGKENGHLFQSSP